MVWAKQSIFKDLKFWVGIVSSMLEKVAALYPGQEAPRTTSYEAWSKLLIRRLYGVVWDPFES